MSLVINALNPAIGPIAVPAAANNMNVQALQLPETPTNAIQTLDLRTDREIGLQNEIANGTLALQQGDTLGNVVNAFAANNQDQSQTDILNSLFSANPRLYSVLVSEGIDFSNFTPDEFQAMTEVDLAQAGLLELETPTTDNSVAAQNTVDPSMVDFQRDLAALALEIYAETTAYSFDAGGDIAQTALENGLTLLSTATTPEALQAALFSARMAVYNDIQVALAEEAARVAEQQAAEEVLEAQQEEAADENAYDNYYTDAENYFLSYIDSTVYSLGTTQSAWNSGYSAAMNALDYYIYEGLNDFAYAYEEAIQYGSQSVYDAINEVYTSDMMQKAAEMEAERLKSIEEAIAEAQKEAQEQSALLQAANNANPAAIWAVNTQMR